LIIVDVAASTGESVAILVARQTNNQTNDRKVAGSRPTKVVCITVLTEVNCPLWPAATPSSALYEVGVLTVSVDGLGSGMVGKW